MIIELDGKKLSTNGDDFWVAPNATVIGNVIMEKDSSIWFQCTIRGDNAVSYTHLTLPTIYSV